jgi:hypothetical protein
MNRVYPVPSLNNGKPKSSLINRSFLKNKRSFKGLICKIFCNKDLAQENSAGIVLGAVWRPSYVDEDTSELPQSLRMIIARDG